MDKYSPFVPDPSIDVECTCWRTDSGTDTENDNEGIEDIEHIAKPDSDDLEAKILNDMKAADVTNATAEAQLEAQREARSANSSLYPQFTEAQRLAAGYLPKPSCIQMTPALSIKDLRGDLAAVAVPIPKDYLLGDMHGENKIPVYDENCNNLLDASYESNKRVAALEGAIRALVGAEMCEKLGLPPAQTKIACLEDASASSAHIPSTNTHTDAGREIVSEQPKNIQQILSMPLSKQYNVECKDIVVCPENQYEIAKYILGNSTTMVKPFSIPAGIISCTEDCLVAIDKPTLHGQPGQLLAIFRKGYFDRAASSHYDPHTYDVYIEDANVVSTEALTPASASVPVNIQPPPGSKYAYDMTV